MIDYVMVGYGTLVLIVFFCAYWLGIKCIRKMAKDGRVQSTKDQHTIKQVIKLADNRMVDLEIRVKVLEDK
jgi:hypothetical protein